MESTEQRAEVVERDDHWFEVPYTTAGGHTGGLGDVRIRPGHSDTTVELDLQGAVGGKAEIELVDLRRALRMAEEANR